MFLRLCLLYSANATFLPCLSLPLCATIPPPPQHPHVGPVSLINKGRALEFIPCNVWIDYYQGMNTSKQRLAPNLLDLIQC